MFSQSWNYDIKAEAGAETLPHINKGGITMKRTPKEIAAERDAKIAEIKAQYTAEDAETSAMCSHIINADYMTEDRRRRVYEEYGITETAVELNRKVKAICNEYAAELAEAIRAENEAEPMPEWLKEVLL